MCYEKNFSLSNPCSAFCFSNIDVTNMEHPLISPRWHLLFCCFYGTTGRHWDLFDYNAIIYFDDDKGWLFL